MLWKTEKFPDHLRDKEAFSNVRFHDRKKNPKEAEDRWFCFFDALVPCIAGKKIWTNQVKISKTITESNCVTVVDEAFTVLCIENYWPKWVKGGVTRWTQSRSGNTGYMGWDKVAYTRFVCLCKHIKHMRETDESIKMEMKFRENAIQVYRGNSGYMRRRGEEDVPSYDELED